MPIPPIASYPLPALVEFPEPRAPWRLEPDRAVLIVHDMQRYFLAPFAPGPPTRTHLVEHVAALVDAARATATPVVFTRQPSAAPLSERGLLADLWGAGVPDEHEGALIPELTPRDDEPVIVRTRYNAFLGSGLDEALHRTGRDQLLICGVYASIGCLITATHAFMTERQPFAVVDAQADFSAADHRQSMTWLAARAAGLVDTAGALATLRALAPA